MSYDISFTNANDEKFSEEEVSTIQEEIRKRFPNAKIAPIEINLEFAQVSFFETIVYLSIPYWKENMSKENEINALLNILFDQSLKCFDSQLNRNFRSFDPCIFENFKLVTPSIIVETPEETFPCGDIRCSQIGIRKLAKILDEHKDVLSLETEKELVRKEDYNKLFLYNLRFACSVARRFGFKWINHEEMIDASIDGFEKGLAKFIETKYDFKVVEYIVWWCQQSCIEYLLRKLWEITAQEGYKYYSNEEAEVVRSKWKNGDHGMIEEVLTNHSFLFKEVEDTYKVVMGEKEKREAITNTLNQKCSLRALELEEYQTYKAELELEDFLLLECAIILDEGIKRRPQ